MMKAGNSPNIQKEGIHMKAHTRFLSVLLSVLLLLGALPVAFAADGEITWSYDDATKTLTFTGNGSGGIMTTGQGVTQASNLTVNTSGDSSAAIRSDRGGGTVTVDGGAYTTSGTGSPAIYATATITVSNATLTTTGSQGVVNEGGNTVILNDCTLNATNASLGSQDYFKNGVFLYQSMSGDASDGASVFTMTGGTLNNTTGHVFHVTNTSAAITLEGVTINNTDSEGVLISVCDDAWSGLTNAATINAIDQTLEGAVLVGSGSTCTINLSGSSVWTGHTSGSITSHRSSSTVSSSLGTVKLVLSDTATVMLDADTTVSSISGTGSINYNGHTLTVGSTTYTSGSPGVNTITETDATAAGSTTETSTNATETSTNATETSTNATEETSTNATEESSTNATEESSTNATETSTNATETSTNATEESSTNATEESSTVKTETTTSGEHTTKASGSSSSSDSSASSSGFFSSLLQWLKSIFEAIRQFFANLF